MVRPSLYLWVLLSLSSAAAAQGALVSVDSRADAYYGAGPSEDRVQVDALGDATETARGSARSAGEGREAVADGQGWASPGRLTNAVESRVSDGDVSDWGGGIAESFLRSYTSDALTLSNAALTGQTGEVTIAYRYQGEMARGGDEGRAGFYLRAGANDAIEQIDGSLNYFTDTDTFRAIPGDAPGEILLTTSFTWGQSFSTFLETYVTTWATPVVGAGDGDALTFASVDLDAWWGGIRSVRQGGALVGDYALSSFSGTDYSRPFDVAAPVPEPGAALLLALGAAGVAWGVRRRRSDGVASADPHGSADPCLLASR